MRQVFSMRVENDGPSVAETLMKPIIRASMVCGALGLAAWGTGGGTAVAQKPAVVSTTFQATATVETVDAKTRQILLKRDDGKFVTLVAGPDVRNFAQIKPGDRVYARYE